MALLHSKMPRQPSPGCVILEDFLNVFEAWLLPLLIGGNYLEYLLKIKIKDPSPRIPRNSMAGLLCV